MSTRQDPKKDPAWPDAAKCTVHGAHGILHNAPATKLRAAAKGNVMGLLRSSQASTLRALPEGSTRSLASSADGESRGSLSAARAVSLSEELAEESEAARRSFEGLEAAPGLEAVAAGGASPAAAEALARDLRAE